MIKREEIEWSDRWVTGAHDESGLPRVLLVGDSITQSYYPIVQAQLKDRFRCARLATSRSVCDPRFTQELALILQDYRFALIHFNNGLHGWDYDEPAYRQGLSGAFDFIQQQGAGAKVVWASSTPVWCVEPPRTLAAKTERVRERNRIAHALATQHHFPINDLFRLVVDRPELFRDDGVHLLPDGQNILGQHTAQIITTEAT